jgi:hypothetical protein
VTFPWLEAKLKKVRAEIARIPDDIDRAGRWGSVARAEFVQEERRLMDEAEEHKAEVLKVLGLSYRDLWDGEGEPTRLHAVPLRDVEPVTRNWLWEPWLPRAAVAVLEATGTADVLAVTLALVARLTGDRAVAEGTGPPGGATVLLLTDDPARDDLRRCLEAGGTDLRRCLVPARLPEGPEWFDFDDVEALAYEAQADLVTIAPLERFWPGDRLAERLAVRLERLAKDTGCAVLVGRDLNGRGKATRALHLAAASVMVCAADPTRPDALALAMRRSRFAPIPPSQSLVPDQAGGLAALRWEGESPWTAEALLGGDSRRLSRLARAAAFLADLLGRGCVEAKEAAALAARAGFSDRTVQRAKAVLGVESRQEGRRWVWELPSGCQVPSGCQTALPFGNLNSGP